MYAPLDFNYGFAPPRARNGMVADFNPTMVDSVILTDANTASGKIMSTVLGDFPGVGALRGVKGRTPGSNVPVIGVVAYNPGLPGDPATPEYVQGNVVPVVRQGRVWVYVENFTTDPVSPLAVSPWFVRESGGSGADPIGNLRFGNDGGGTCAPIANGHLRPLDCVPQPGSAALVLLDVNFRNQDYPNVNTSWNYRGEFSAPTMYGPGDVVHFMDVAAGGLYITNAPTTGVLPNAGAPWTRVSA